MLVRCNNLPQNRKEKVMSKYLMKKLTFRWVSLERFTPSCHSFELLGKKLREVSTAWFDILLNRFVCWVSVLTISLCHKLLLDHVIYVAMLYIFILYSTGYLTWGLFLERTSNYEPPKSFFMLVMFTFMIEISIGLTLKNLWYEGIKLNFFSAKTHTLVFFISKGLNFYWNGKISV